MKRLFLFIFCGALLCSLSLSAKRRVHTIGDSTMSEYKPAATPKRGWGMYLQAFFNADSVEVNNRGKSGASTRTFYETANLWPSVKSQMAAGDYLIIQFAHNDEKCKGMDVYDYNQQMIALGKDTTTDMRGTHPTTTYKAYLRKFINEARAMGVTPILMSPICRAYFQKDGTISMEGQHNLRNKFWRMENGVLNEKASLPETDTSMDYVLAMQEIAKEMDVPFLDMTSLSMQFYQRNGKEHCMNTYFNCGDKTHTSAKGGMAIAALAYQLINQSYELTELKSWTVFPSATQFDAYAERIETAGKKAAFNAKGTPFSQVLEIAQMVNIEHTKKGFIAAEQQWPAGEIDEVANRYIEYTIAAEKKKGLVIESITVPVRARGGEGMNIHINYGFGEQFREVTTIYENTALPKNKWLTIALDQPILVPAGQTLHIRILPWYDSNGKPQKKKYLQVKPLQISGKRLK